MIQMPKFIGCLFAGAVGRNVLEAMHKETYTWKTAPWSISR